MSEDKLEVQSLVKAMRVLEAWRDDRQFLSLAEVAARAGLDKSAAQRFCHTFEKCGYLRKDATTRRYGLGTKVLDRSHAFLRTHPVVERAMPLLLDLRRACGQHVMLSLFDDTTAVYAIRRQSEQTSFSTSVVGRRLPIHTTAGGRAMLAALSDDRARDIVRRAEMVALTPRTETDREAILADVARVRRARYSLLSDQVLMGEIVVGAAVIDEEAAPVAAVHIAGRTGEWEGTAFARRFAPLVLEAAQSLARYDPTATSRRPGARTSGERHFARTSSGRPFETTESER